MSIPEAMLGELKQQHLSILAVDVTDLVEQLKPKVGGVGDGWKWDADAPKSRRDFAKWAAYAKETLLKHRAGTIKPRLRDLNKASSTVVV